MIWGLIWEKLDENFEMYDDVNDMEKVVCIMFLKWFIFWCGKELYLVYK